MWESDGGEICVKSNYAANYEAFAAIRQFGLEQAENQGYTRPVKS